MTLSQRTDVFSSAGAPRPAPYYRIVIKAALAEHIGRTILWVPSKKLWFDAEDVTPPLPGFWRTAGTAKDFPGLAALAGKVTLYPAPKRWVLPHY